MKREEVFMNEEITAGEETSVEVSENTDEVIENTVVESIETSQEENVNENRKPYPSTGILSIRIIVGLYVLYNMYQVITSDSEKAVYLYVIVVLMTLVALFLVGTSLIHYIKGEYSGGKADKKQT